NTPAPPGPATFPTSPKNSIPGAEAPPPPVWPDQAGPSGVPAPEPPPPSPPDQAWSPGNAPRVDPYQNSGGGRRPAELGPPMGVFGAPPGAAPPPAAPSGPPTPVILRPEGIASDTSQVRADPLIRIPPHVPREPQISPCPA